MSWISWIKLKIIIEYWINFINSNNEIELYLNWANMNHRSSPPIYRLEAVYPKIRIGYFNAGEGETDYNDESKYAG